MGTETPELTVDATNRLTDNGEPSSIATKTPTLSRAQAEHMTYQLFADARARTPIEGGRFANIANMLKSTIDNLRGLKGLRQRMGDTVLGKARHNDAVEQMVSATNADAATALRPDSFKMNDKGQLLYAGVRMDAHSRTVHLARGGYESSTDIQAALTVAQTELASAQGSGDTTAIESIQAKIQGLEVDRYTFAELSKKAGVGTSAEVQNHAVAEATRVALELQNKIDSSKLSKGIDASKRATAYVWDHKSEVIVGGLALGAVRGAAKVSRTVARFTPVGIVGSAGIGAVGGSITGAIEGVRSAREANRIVQAAAEAGDIAGAVGTGTSTRNVERLREAALAHGINTKEYKQALRRTTGRSGAMGQVSGAVFGAAGALVTERAARAAYNFVSTPAGASEMTLTSTSAPTKIDGTPSTVTQNTQDTIGATNILSKDLLQSQSSSEQLSNMAAELQQAWLAQHGGQLPDNPASTLQRAVVELTHDPNKPPTLTGQRLDQIAHLGEHQLDAGSNWTWELKNLALASHPEHTYADLDSPEFQQLFNDATVKFAEAKGMSVEDFYAWAQVQPPGTNLFADVDNKAVFEEFFLGVDAKWPPATPNTVLTDLAHNQPDSAIVNMKWSDDMGKAYAQMDYDQVPGAADVQYFTLLQSSLEREVMEINPNLSEDAVREAVSFMMANSRGADGYVLEGSLMDYGYRGPVADRLIFPIRPDQIKGLVDTSLRDKQASLSADILSIDKDAALNEIKTFAAENRYFELKGLADDKGAQERIIAAYYDFLKKKESSDLTLDDLDTMRESTQLASVAQETVAAIQQAAPDATIPGVSTEGSGDASGADIWPSWTGEAAGIVGGGVAIIATEEALRRKVIKPWRRNRRARRATTAAPPGAAPAAEPPPAAEAPEATPPEAPEATPPAAEAEAPEATPPPPGAEAPEATPPEAVTPPAAEAETTTPPGEAAEATAVVVETTPPLPGAEAEATAPEAEAPEATPPEAEAPAETTTMEFPLPSSEDMWEARHFLNGILRLRGGTMSSLVGLKWTVNEGENGYTNLVVGDHSTINLREGGSPNDYWNYVLPNWIISQVKEAKQAELDVNKKIYFDDMPVGPVSAAYFDEETRLEVSITADGQIAVVHQGTDGAEVMSPGEFLMRRYPSEPTPATTTAHTDESLVVADLSNASDSNEAAEVAPNTPDMVALDPENPEVATGSAAPEAVGLTTPEASAAEREAEFNRILDNGIGWSAFYSVPYPTSFASIQGQRLVPSELINEKAWGIMNGRYDGASDRGGPGSTIFCAYTHPKGPLTEAVDSQYPYNRDNDAVNKNAVGMTIINDLSPWKRQLDLLNDHGLTLPEDPVYICFVMPQTNGRNELTDGRMRLTSFEFGGFVSREEAEKLKNMLNGQDFREFMRAVAKHKGANVLVKADGTAPSDFDTGLTTTPARLVSGTGLTKSPIVHFIPEESLLPQASGRST